MFAVRHRKLAMLQFIFQRDDHHIAADTRDDKDSRMALMAASVKSQIDIFRLIIEHQYVDCHGVNITMKDPRG